MATLQRSKITITAYRDSCPDFDELLKAREEIPEEYRNTSNINIEIDSDPYGDSSTAYLILSYTRDETDSEMNSRIIREKNNRDIIEQREYEFYKKLDAKFGQHP